jgi:hypothetical protein
VQSNTRKRALQSAESSDVFGQRAIGENLLGQPLTRIQLNIDQAVTHLASQLKERRSASSDPVERGVFTGATASPWSPIPQTEPLINLRHR